jgi:hypothetical protein
VALTSWIVHHEGVSVRQTLRIERPSARPRQPTDAARTEVALAGGAEPTPATPRLTPAPAPEPEPEPSTPKASTRAESLELDRLTVDAERWLSAKRHALVVATNPVVERDPGRRDQRVVEAAEPLLATRPRKDISYTFTVPDATPRTPSRFRGVTSTSAAACSP